MCLVCSFQAKSSLVEVHSCPAGRFTEQKIPIVPREYMGNAKLKFRVPRSVLSMTKVRNKPLAEGKATCMCFLPYVFK